jgi:hypothetical protein
MKLRRWLCVLTCFPVAVSDELQALITCDSYVIFRAQWLSSLKGVLVWGVLWRMLVT